MAEAKRRWSSGQGIEIEITESFRRALAEGRGNNFEDAGLPKDSPFHFTFLCLKDYWDSKQI